ncbi:type VI secretion protein [Streptomyces agglomeratus]|uniref:Type VI secretion protein n=1 Tax=Streptomyces agglomeratus TaxID=285458 RepID=A0A1E5P9H5_9ACTN|nr:type IV secretory system conjugative DNA transfer family protein [Streptomyces agglomeratus]OEJ26213.1 type VI secretion protein [Streptomyces agglomeratus]
MRQHHDGRHGHQQPGERGIPDSLLVGLLAFLLGLTILAWLATGLAGLFARGAWPDGVTFARTPLALRRLLGAPQDIAAAWPDTPPDQLSGYGLFWGLLIGELMVACVLTIFVIGVLARLKAQRETARAAATTAKQTGAEPHYNRPAAPPHAGAGTRPGDAEGTGAGHVPAAVPHTGAGAAYADYKDYADYAGHESAALPHPDHAGGSARTGVHGPGHESAARPEPAAAHTPGTESASSVSAAAPLHAAATAPGPHPGVHPGTHPGTHPPGSQAATSPYLPTRSASAVPAPRTPRLLYGSPEARRPTAVQAVLDAEGPALVVTSDPSLWAETKGARAKLGPVLVYDPGHLCDTPARLHWSPTTGCDRSDIAAARAVALLAPIRPQARLDAAMADTAETLLSSWLHAAAVDGRPFRQVHRWAQGHSAHEPVRILRTHPEASSGAAGLLESALTAYPERREIAQELTVRALAALSSVHIREVCTPNRNDSVTLESFADEGGTLYVVGEAIEDPKSRPGAMPLLTALTSSVVEHGRRMAARSSDGRLDPPMTFVLDDVAAVAPLPQLPELLSTGQDQGLPTLVLLRSQEQGRARWPDHTLAAG